MLQALHILILLLWHSYGSLHCFPGLQRLLLEVQSATAVYPATVPLLLQALDSQQRQHLAHTLTRTAQQEQQQLHAEHTQQQQQNLHVAGSPAVWVQLLHQLSMWDVLLLLGLFCQPQWEVDASLVLLQGLQDMTRLVHAVDSIDLRRSLRLSCHHCSSCLASWPFPTNTPAQLGQEFSASAAGAAGGVLRREKQHQGCVALLKQVVGQHGGRTSCTSHCLFEPACTLCILI